jgi:hypothetical protein
LGTDRSPQLDQPEGATFCARHPQVETYLRCSRCETPICPRCLVQTPVGARCRECANVSRLPTFNVTPVFLARGLAAAMISGAVAGWFWALVATNIGFGLFIGLFVGLGVGWVISESVSLAANRKRGLGLQLCAVAGIALAFLVQDVVTDVPGFLQSSFTVSQLITAGIAAFWAASRLKIG